MKKEDAVPVPALRGDDLHTMTVLPYLIAYHYGSDENPQFVTAHELNGGYPHFEIIMSNLPQFIIFFHAQK